jgi:hypothetical protein
MRTNERRYHSCTRSFFHLLSDYFIGELQRDSSVLPWHHMHSFLGMPVPILDFTGLGGWEQRA